MVQHVKNYNFVARLFHWLSAITIIGMFALGLWMMDLTYYSQWYKTAPYWHKSVGILLAMATLIRFIWKSLTAAPEVEGRSFEVTAAKAAHWFMYVLMLILFVSGYLISTSDGRGIEVFSWFVVPGLGELFKGQSDIAGQVHYYVAFTLIGLAAVHALAALKHHFINKDNTLNKMTGKVK